MCFFLSQQCSVFFFDKRDGDRLFKPKRKDEIFIKMRDAIENLQTGEYKQTLVIIHKLEEGPNTMAFATEPVMTSLHHIFAWYVSIESYLGTYLYSKWEIYANPLNFDKNWSSESRTRVQLGTLK